jgi:hypothetical protein
VAALVVVVVMTVAMHVLVSMFPGLMSMLMTVMGMRHGPVIMLVLMFVFVVAAHFDSPPFVNISEYKIIPILLMSRKTVIVLIEPINPVVRPDRF